MNGCSGGAGWRGGPDWGLLDLRGSGSSLRGWIIVSCRGREEGSWRSEVRHVYRACDIPEATDLLLLVQDHGGGRFPGGEQTTANEFKLQETFCSNDHQNHQNPEGAELS